MEHEKYPIIVGLFVFLQTFGLIVDTIMIYSFYTAAIEFLTIINNDGVKLNMRCNKLFLIVVSVLLFTSRIDEHVIDPLILID